MITLEENVAWGSNPTIYVSFYYEKTRDGTSMKYRTKTVISPLTGSSYFGYSIQQLLHINNEEKENEVLKDSSPSQWGDDIEYTSPWYTVPNKTSGTTPVTFNVYSNSGRDEYYTYSMDIDPAYASVTQSLNSKTSSSIKINWSSDSTIDHIWYSINNGSSWVDAGAVNASSGNYNITGLSANTSYNIKTRVRRAGTTLTTDSTALSVTTYQRTIPTISLSSKSVNSVTVISGCNVTVSSTQYRIKTSSGSYGGYQNSATFSGLTPNTAYIVEVKKVGQASGEAGTATLSVTTYQIGEITSASNFNHGDNASLVITNPSGTSLILQMKIGATQIFSKSVSAGTITNTFTDTELDNIYKLYGNGNTLTVTYILTTTANGTSYTNNRNCTVTLTGKQKTGHINVNGTWKRTQRWVNVNGTWKRAVRWINVNGTWKRCI